MHGSAFATFRAGLPGIHRTIRTAYARTRIQYLDSKSSSDATRLAKTPPVSCISTRTATRVGVWATGSAGCFSLCVSHPLAIALRLGR